MRSPNPTGRAPLFTAIATASSSKAFTVGYYYDSRDVAQTLGALWDGRRWVLQQIPNYGYDSRLYGIAAVSPDEVIAVGMYDTPLGRQRTFALRWSGAGWTITPTPNVAYGNYLQGAGRIPGTSDVWAVGSSTNQDNTYQSLIQRYSC